MKDKQKPHSNKEPETIAELILASARLRSLGEGSTSKVYPIASPLFEGYVLKLRKWGKKSIMAADNEIFTPAIIDTRDLNEKDTSRLAQRLCLGIGIEILQRAPGTALGQLHRQHLSQLRKRRKPDISLDSLKWQAHLQVMEMLAHIDDSEYVSLLNRMNFLTQIGQGCEGGDNILASYSGFALVDLEQGISLNTVNDMYERLVSAIMPSEAPASAIAESINQAKETIYRKLLAAAQKTDLPTPVTRDEMSKTKMNTNILSGRVSVMIGRFLPLSAAPSELRKMLNELENKGFVRQSP